LSVLETGRLILRQLTEEDAEFIVELLNDPAFLRFIGDRNVRTIEDARRYILTGPTAMYARHGIGLLLVEMKDSSTPIGICGLIKRDTLEDIDVGFAFLPVYRGHGYAREATAAVLDHGRNTLGLRRIVAIVNPENVVSARLLHDLGFTFEQTVKLAPDAPEIDLLASMTDSTRPMHRDA
jgi:[ribosomal protein S5]-alanine N-acetyltransferase